MLRYLPLFLLIVLAVWWLRRTLNTSRRPGTKPPPTPSAGTLTEAMPACRHCGVHVPESEGLRLGEDFYCCEEHRRLGAGPR